MATEESVVQEFDRFCDSLVKEMFKIVLGSVDGKGVIVVPYMSQRERDGVTDMGISLGAALLVANFIICVGGTGIEMKRESAPGRRGFTLTYIDRDGKSAVITVDVYKSSSLNGPLSVSVHIGNPYKVNAHQRETERMFFAHAEDLALQQAALFFIRMQEKGRASR